MNKNILNTKEVNQLIDRVNVLTGRIDFLETALHENYINWNRCDICGNPITHLLTTPFRECGAVSCISSNGIVVRVDGSKKYFCWECIPVLREMELSRTDEAEILSTIAYWIHKFGQYKLFLIKDKPNVQRLFKDEEIIDAGMMLPYP